MRVEFLDVETLEGLPDVDIPSEGKHSLSNPARNDIHLCGRDRVLDLLVPANGAVHQPAHRRPRYDGQGISTDGRGRSNALAWRRVRQAVTSFCACELRSPAPFTEAGFVAFNRVYVGTLERWGIYRDEENPVARSNVCPEIGAPAEPSFEAFCYTVPAASGSGPASFGIAGSGEAPEGAGSYTERTIRLGDTSADGMREKVRYVLGAMEARMAALDVGWADVSATQVYTVYDLHPFLADEIVARGAAAAGLTWYYARPPVEGLDYEMDVRGVPTERVL